MNKDNKRPADILDDVQEKLLHAFEDLQRSLPLPGDEVPQDYERLARIIEHMVKTLDTLRRFAREYDKQEEEQNSTSQSTLLAEIEHRLGRLSATTEETDIS